MLKRNRIITAVCAFVLLAGVGLFFLTDYKSTADTTGTAIVSVAPSSATKTVGDTLQVQVKLTTDKEVTVVGIDINYSNNLTYESFDSAGSVFAATITDPNPASNHFKIERARFDTGYKGTDGLIGTLNFKTNAPGQANVTINKAATEVLDATNQQNLIGTAQAGSYTVESATTPVVNEPPSNPATDTQNTSTTDTATTTDNNTSDTDTGSSGPTSPTTDTHTNNTIPSPSTKTTTVPKKETPTTTSTPVVTKASPSLTNSTVTPDKDCSVAGGTDYFTLSVIIKDDSGNPLNDDEYKPKISVTPKDGLTGTILKKTDGEWLVKLRSASAQLVTAQVGVQGKLLNTLSLNFADTCDSNVATSDTTVTNTPSDVVSTPSTTVGTSKKNNLLYYIIGAVVVAIALGGGALFLRKPKTVDEIPEETPPAEIPPTQTPPTV